MKWLRALVIGMLLFVLCPMAVHAGEETPPEGNTESPMEGYDISEIEEYLHDTVPDADISFGEIVGLFFQGNTKDALSKVFTYLNDLLFSELKDNGSGILQLMLFAVFAALFVNFASAFQSSQIATSALWVLYIMTAGLLGAVFVVNVSIASGFLGKLNEFVRILIPTYSASIAVVKGASASLVYYEVLLFVSTAVYTVLLYVILPAIQIHFVIMLINQVAQEDVLSKTVELLASICDWGLKALFSLIIGLQLIQGLIVPAAASLKHGIFGKAMSALPVIGGSIESASEVILGSGVLIKNGIGVAGMIFIVVISAVPVVKLAFISLLYHAAAAVIQPIAEKRMVEAVNGTALSVRLLLRAVCVAALCLLASLAVISGFTGIG